MRNRLAAITLTCILALGSFGALAQLAPTTSARINADSCEVRVRANGTEQWQAMDPSFCTFPTPTATATATATATLAPPTPTATAVPPTPTSTPTPPATGWHPPTTHEHGTEPPVWAVGAFSQSGESHVGYKGMYAQMANGTESYLITHILATEGARSHGDHDYQFWLRLPNGAVLFWQGRLDFSPDPNNPTAPVFEATADNGQRPIVISVNEGPCETWYSRQGSTLFDLGWTICGRYQAFDGTIRGGNGAFRGADWVLPCDRLPANSPAQPYCVTEYGVRRFTFIVSGTDFGAPGVVPIN